MWEIRFFLFINTFLKMEKSSHVIWDCCYHVVIVPKYRKKVLYGKVRSRVKEILHKLAAEKGVEILEGSLCEDHIHMLVSIPPKYSVAEVMGFMKGKSAIRLHNEFGKNRQISQKKFWSRGYFVRTGGLDKEKIKNYIKNQWNKDQREDGNQMDFGW